MECVAIRKCKQPCLEARGTNVRQFPSASKQTWRRRRPMCGNSQVQASTPGGASTECAAIHKCRQARLEAQAPNVAIHKCGQACLELDPSRVETENERGPTPFAISAFMCTARIHVKDPRIHMRSEEGPRRLRISVELSLCLRKAGSRKIYKNTYESDRIQVDPNWILCG